MNAIIKEKLSIKMRLAHLIARNLKGDYSARLSLALKMINKIDYNEEVNGFDTDLYIYGLGKYWNSIRELYAMPLQIIEYVNKERSLFSAKETVDYLNNYK